MGKKVKGIFITGTDTGVGKTFISCIIAQSLRKKGLKVGVMKPIETGCKRKGAILVPRDGILLKKAAKVNDPINMIVPYRFHYPLSPFMAAILEGKRISIPKIKNIFLKFLKKYDFILLEGAGGILVPITKNFSYINLIKELNLSPIIIASNRLGVINHTLLTLSLLSYYKITPQCIILNNLSARKDISQKTNLSALNKLIKNTIVFDFPYKPNRKFKERLIDLINIV